MLSCYLTVCFAERRNTQQTISKQDNYCPWDKAAASIVWAVCPMGRVEAPGHTRAQSTSPLQWAATGPATRRRTPKMGRDLEMCRWAGVPGTWCIQRLCIQPRARHAVHRFAVAPGGDGSLVSLLPSRLGNEVCFTWAAR